MPIYVTVRFLRIDGTSPSQITAACRGFYSDTHSCRMSAAWRSLQQTPVMSPPAHVQAAELFDNSRAGACCKADCCCCSLGHLR